MLSKFKNQIENAGVGDGLIKARGDYSLNDEVGEGKSRYHQKPRARREFAGSGVEVQDVNKLLKQYEQMATMMKKNGQGRRVLPVLLQ